MMKKVYILEDDEDFQEVLGHVLGKEYELGQATELDLPALRNFQPDLVIMDHHLGPLTSETILQSIRAEIPGFKAPVVLFSGAPELEKKTHPLVAGYIRKPAGIQEIREYLRGFFQKAS